MGTEFLDKYSLLHFASGVIAFFWAIPIQKWFILHLLFEAVENTAIGMHIINTYITSWPGGKTYPDSYINMISDQTFGVLGWYFASWISKKL